jgi:MFS family permease
MSAVNDNRRAAAPPWAVLLVMCVGYFLVLLDVTIVNVALPTIGHKLRVSVSGLQWVVDGALPAGPLLGGLLVQTVGWRWVFLVNVPIVAVASVAAARMVTESRARAAHRLDLPGATLAALVLVGVTFAVIEAATVAQRCPSSSPRGAESPLAPGSCSPNAALASPCSRWACCASAPSSSPMASPGP